MDVYWMYRASSKVAWQSTTISLIGLSSEIWAQAQNSCERTDLGNAQKVTQLLLDLFHAHHAGAALQVAAVVEVAEIRDGLGARACSRSSQRSVLACFRKDQNSAHQVNCCTRECMNRSEDKFPVCQGRTSL